MDETGYKMSSALRLETCQGGIRGTRPGTRGEDLLEKSLNVHAVRKRCERKNKHRAFLRLCEWKLCPWAAWCEINDEEVVEVGD